MEGAVYGGEKQGHVGGKEIGGSEHVLKSTIQLPCGDISHLCYTQKLLLLQLYCMQYGQ